MASVNQSTLTVRQIQAALRRGVKDTLVASGIQPATRRGNKELTLAVQRLAQHSYGTLDEATQAGQALGQKIVDRSQAKGTTDLDGGIVRQLLLTGEIPTVAKAKPPKPAAVSEPQAKAPVAPSNEVVEPAMAKAIAEAAEVEPTDLEPTDLEPADADLTVAELETPGAGETVDAAIADAPSLDAMETLDPAAIEAPDSEPITAADTEAAAAVESA
ncbi:MAG: hypothetical protein ACFCVB_00675 [Nodosilinea sp.]